MHKIRILAMDVDGTLTDGKIYMGVDGEIMKAFSVQDGYAIKHILRSHGIEPVIITARESRIVENRCRELNITKVLQGCSDKAEKLRVLAGEISMETHDGKLPGVAYIGDDMPDLECIRMAEISGCPADACMEIREQADYVCRARGGEGAVREFVEWLIDTGDEKSE